MMNTTSEAIKAELKSQTSQPSTPAHTARVANDEQFAAIEGEDLDRYLHRSSSPIDFTILLDPNGTALKDWKVHVFPTSFLIDPEGNIRYSVAGSMEWDGQDPASRIKSLMPAAAETRASPAAPAK